MDGNDDDKPESKHQVSHENPSDLSQTITILKDKYRISVRKSDEDGKSLEARFYLYRKSDLVHLIDRANTNTNQDNLTALHREDLELLLENRQDYEDFVVRELVAPDGYVQESRDIIVRIHVDGRAEIVNSDEFLGTDGTALVTVTSEEVSGKRQISLSIKNVLETQMKLKKVDASTQGVLPGAEFALADSEENARIGKFLKRVRWESDHLGERITLVNETDPLYIGLDSKHKAESEYTVTTGEDGIATFDHLDLKKTYYAVEVVAPESYTLDKTPLALTKDNASNETAAVKNNHKNQYVIKVKKTDEDGKDLIVRFYFYRIRNGKEQYENRTNTDKTNPAQLHANTLALSPDDGKDYGDFIVRETVAPDGYLRLPADIKIRISMSGQLTVLNQEDFRNLIGNDESSLVDASINEVDGKCEVLITIRNKKETVMKIKKLDATDSEHLLAGAKFALADSEENAKLGKFLKRITREEEYSGTRTYLVNETDPLYIGLDTNNKTKAEYTVTTGEDGIATFEHLDPRKTYYAVEIKAPNEYQLDQTPQTLNKDTSANPLVFKNIKRGIFPRTGGIGMLAFVLAGLSLMVFATYSKHRYKPKH